MRPYIYKKNKIFHYWFNRKTGFIILTHSIIDSYDQIDFELALTLELRLDLTEILNGSTTLKKLISLLLLPTFYIYSDYEQVVSMDLASLHFFNIIYSHYRESPLHASMKHNVIARNKSWKGVIVGSLLTLLLTEYP